MGNFVASSDIGEGLQVSNGKLVVKDELSVFRNPDGTKAIKDSTEIEYNEGTVRLGAYDVDNNSVDKTGYVFVEDISNNGLLKKISLADLAKLLGVVERPISISGYVITGQTISVSDYGSEGSVADNHQWYSDGVAIAGATNTTLVVTPDLEGTSIDLKINGSFSNVLRNFYPLDVAPEVWIDPSVSLSGEFVNRGTGDQPSLFSGTQQGLGSVNSIATHLMTGQRYFLPDQFNGDISNLTIVTAWRENVRVNNVAIRLNNNTGASRSLTHIPWGDGRIYFDFQGIDDRFSTQIGGAGQTLLISYQNNTTDAFANIYKTGDLNPTNPYEDTQGFNTPSDPSTGMFLGEGLVNHDMLDQVFSSAVLSTEARKRIEGYVAHKYGLQNTLPDSHPYKLAPA